MQLLALWIKICAALSPWLLVQSWITHTATRTLTSDGGRKVTGTSEVTGNSEDYRSLTLANDPTQRFTASWVFANMKSFEMKSSIAATVTFYDDADVVLGTHNLAANKALQWAYGDSGDPPFSGDCASFNVSSAAAGTLELLVLQDSGVAASAALTGTFLTTPTEAEVVTGGQTIIITLTGATFVAGGAFDAQRQAIIDGLVASTSQTNGWNNEVQPTLGLTDVVRTSGAVVTITLPAVGSYSIATNEVVTATVPAGATTATTPIVATPDITIVAA